MYLDWENQAQDYYAVDVETDGLDYTKIWCMCWENIRTQEKGTCTSYDEIKDFLERTHGNIYVGHNFIKFDVPAIAACVGVRLRINSVVDTLVLSTLYNPSLAGGHSLGAWGERFGTPKPEHEDWGELSPEMIHRCQVDTSITAILFRKAVKVLSNLGFSERSIWIQHRITEILFQQQQNGFKFDGERALVFYQQLRKREEELQDEIRRVFPAERVLVRSGQVFTATGTERAIYTRDSRKFEIEKAPDGLSYQAFEAVAFNIGSPKQRIEKLTTLGWTTDERTPKGQLKASEKSLIAFAEKSGIPEVALITRWMAINGRANMINTWLENWNVDTGCIHGQLFVADTLRFRHQKPNTANVPAVRVDKDGNVLYGEAGYYTYESRDLWTARAGRVLVGTDAAGLELRMLAHYLNRPEFTRQVIDGDPHQYNAGLAGVTRPRAKTLLYAIQYGAQAAKVASIIEGTFVEGKRMREQFLERLGIKGVMDDAIAEQGRGRISLVDGSQIQCPSPHAALNYKLQGGGARVMSLGAILLNSYIQRAGLDSLKVGDIHDEWQYDVHPDDAAEHSRLSVQAIRDAGETLNLNLPLDGTAKEGRTWAQTH